MTTLAVTSVNSLRCHASTCSRIGSKFRCIRSTPTERQSMSENDFECFASTGVNTPATMSPNSECREGQLPRRLAPVVGSLSWPITSRVARHPPAIRPQALWGFQLHRTQTSGDLHTSLDCPSYRQVSKAGSRVTWSFVSPHALASCVGCDLEAVPAWLHAAPASRPLLAGVMKVQYTLITLTDAAAIHIGEQRRRAMRQRGKQSSGWRASNHSSVAGASTRLQLGTQGMVCHESV